MSTVYQGLAPATYFTATAQSWRGTGVAISLPDGQERDYLTLLSGLHATICVIHLTTPDPGRSALTDDDAEMNDLWSAQDLSSTVNTVFSALLASSFTTVHISISCPDSWLSEIESTLTGDEGLSAYVRYVIAGLAWLRQVLPADASSLVKYIETFDGPDVPGHHVAPNDLVRLTTRLRTTLASSPIGVTGPALSQTMSIGMQQEAYTNAYVNGVNSLALFTSHAEPNMADVENPALHSDEHNGTDGQSDLLYRSLQKTIAAQASVAWEKERWVTSWGRRPVLPSAGEDDQETQYAKAAARGLCSIIKAGFSTACFHELVGGHDAMYKSSGGLTRFGSFFRDVSLSFPVTGQIFASEEMTSGDDTLKCMILSPRGDRFAIMLCRPPTPDGTEGKLRLMMRNPLWTNQHQITDVKLTGISAEAASGMTHTTRITQGQATLTLEGVPYDSSVILVTGLVSLDPPIDRPPLPATPETGDESGAGRENYLETILQVPVSYGVPVTTSGSPFVEGTFFYDNGDDLAKVFCGGKWIEAIMLGHTRTGS